MNLSEQVHPFLCFKPHFVIVCSEFPLEDTVNDGVVDGPAHLLDTKFLTGFDLATTTLSSQSPSCCLLAMVSEQFYKLNSDQL